MTTLAPVRSDRHIHVISAKLVPAAIGGPRTRPDLDSSIPNPIGSAFRRQSQARATMPKPIELPPTFARRFAEDMHPISASPTPSNAGLTTSR